MSSDRVTTERHTGATPGREATTGVNVPPGGGGPRRRRHEEPEFRSYYGQPIINKPVWESPDIPGYLFLGGLAGASALLSAAAQLTRRPALARVSKLGAAVAGNLSLAALVHDLGRRSRFVNMLRVFKVTSPMSVGSWLLSGFVPAASAAAVSDLTGVAPVIGGLATAGAAALGAPVATYTAALISDTAVPAWHDGHRWMPFVFVSSALSSAAGLGLLGAPVAETAPLRPLAVGAGLAELATEKLMEKRMGVAGEAYHEGRAEKLMHAAEGLTLAGVALAATARRSRVRAGAAGAALLVGSACTRFGIFHAGLTSAENPEHTVKPQRQRLEARGEQR